MSDFLRAVTWKDAAWPLVGLLTLIAITANSVRALCCGAAYSLMDWMNR